MSFASRVFYFAALYGFLAVPPLFFTEDKLGRDFPPAITHPEFYYGFAAVALAWQLAFVLIAREPARLRPMMLPAMLEKLGFGLGGVVLFIVGRAAPLTLMGALVDLIFVVLFYLAYARTAKEN